MNRDLTMHDVIVSGIAVAAGIAAAVLLRVILKWLGVRADRTRWGGDDIIVHALQALAPWAAITGGAAVAASVLPLTARVGRNVTMTLTAVLIMAATGTVRRSV
ncbi:hypothetical protein [Streptomyces sp. NPDC005408]|uniref:hypothetical protein n=1 Tax=Streptomyces sp. NPDC005408 TaxID=3155341 RepID=UPI0033B90992